LVGVPPYMVEVQVSAHHGVDVMTADAEALQVLEKTVRKIAKHVKVASATGADAGIDYDNPLRRLHYETLEVHPLPALGRRVMRVQPLQRDHLLRRRVGHGHVDVVLEVPQFDDACHGDVADPP